jgi:hypothetical protein
VCVCVCVCVDGASRCARLGRVSLSVPCLLPTNRRAVTGMSAGALASFLACPVEVCLVRMQADGRLPLDQRRGYRNVFDALWRVRRTCGCVVCCFHHSHRRDAWPCHVETCPVGCLTD